MINIFNIVKIILEIYGFDKDYFVGVNIAVFENVVNVMIV